MVILNVEIFNDGSVGEVNVYQPSGYSLLDRSAIKAVKKWRFTSTRKNGFMEPIHRKIPILFKLK